MQHSSATISDGGLVRRTLAGDPDGFGELHRRYYARVVGVVTGILKDRARAEEEVQEAYLTALESLPRLADRERFYPWLRRIAVNRAIEAMAALAPSNSSRVLIKGVRLAAGHIAPPAVREALRPLLSGGVSTSVQLAAIDALSDRSAEAQVRAIVSAALDPDQSTRVNLKSVEVLAPHAREADARDALIGVLAPGYSTSVVSAALRALEHLAGSDRDVRAAFLSVLEHGDISYRARIRAGDRLSEQADARERIRIADAMGEVVTQVRREHWGRWTRAVIENALDVLGKVDPARAEALTR